MKRSLLSYLAPICLALSLGLGSGCESGVAKIKPKGKVEVAIPADKKAAGVSAISLNEIVVSLPPPKIEGYRWVINFLDARFLKQTSEIMPPDDTHPTPWVSFVAIFSGRTRIRFILLPGDNDRESKPVDEREVIVEIE